MRAVPLFDADAQLIGAISVFRDVESTESEVQASRMRSAVTANMAEGVTVIRAGDGQMSCTSTTSFEPSVAWEPDE